MLDFYRETCTCDIWPPSMGYMGMQDPMIEEALPACAEALARPLSFSLRGGYSEDVSPSLTYTPNATSWDKVAELNEEASALGLGNVIHFGSGVQQEVDGQVVTTGITQQELLLEEHRSKIVDSLFVPCEQPILETPQPQQQKSKARPHARGGKTTIGALRRSTRQSAKPCSVPVAKRASHRLLKAFGIAGAKEPIGEEALEALARTFDTALSPE
jgi:hypothetical protein